VFEKVHLPQRHAVVAQDVVGRRHGEVEIGDCHQILVGRVEQLDFSGIDRNRALVGRVKGAAP
jgi:hypothetical protein